MISPENNQRRQAGRMPSELMTDELPAAERRGSEVLTISCYRDEIPDYAEAELERLYGSAFSSLKHFRIHGGLAGVNTYVVRRHHTVEALFLFRIDGSSAQVLNEVIHVSQEDAERFAEYVFDNFPKAELVSFKAIRTDLRTSSFPFQRHNFSEDIVVALPHTAQEYHASLAKTIRRNVKYYTNRLKREHPDFSFEVKTGRDVSLQQIREIVDLNRARMTVKGKVSNYNDEEIARLAQMVRECGMVGVATVDGRICAGAVCVAVGGHYFLHIIAHDPAFDDYRIGTLCCYHTICACIARGGQEFHFLWGRYEYKFSLQGVLRDLEEVKIYRSYRHMLKHAGTALRVAYRGRRRQAKLWLDEARQNRSFAGRAVLALLSLRNRPFGSSLRSSASAAHGAEAPDAGIVLPLDKEKSRSPIEL